MQKETSPENDDIQFWDRMNFLIGNERPFPWSERIGLNRSSFQSARSRCKKPLPKTLKQWAEKIGCSYEWLSNGTGEAFPGRGQVSKSMGIGEEKAKEALPGHINDELLFQCYESTEGALYATYRLMDPDDKSEFILKFYKLLSEEKGLALNVNEDTLLLSIFTIEIALYYTRQIMSSKSKTELISDVYKLYDDKPEMKQQTLDEYNQYKRSK